jgi:hypothetical protein
MFQYKYTIFRENKMPVFRNQLPKMSYYLQGTSVHISFVYDDYK